MQSGKVKYFNKDKGYGFISSGEKDYFVFYKEILGPGKHLNIGDMVSFDPSTSEKGPIAKNVKIDSLF